MRWLWTALLLLAGGVAAPGQWLTQRIPLQPGWNAVCLEVQPEPDRCDVQCAGLPIEGIWKWNDSDSTRQFETDPTVPLPEEGDWLVWLSSNDERRVLNTLFGIEAWQGYLVKVATNAAPFTWAVKGRVKEPELQWRPYTMNLIGLPVHSNHPPSFADFFRPTAEVPAQPSSDSQIYTVNSAGQSDRIRQTARVTIESGRAYWIGVQNPVTFTGPLAVTPAPGLDYGMDLNQIELTVANISTTTPLDIVIAPRNSEPAPAGYPEVAGAVPLAYYNLDDASTNDLGWQTLTAAGLRQTLAPRDEWTLLMGVRRSDFPSYNPAGTNGAVYQSFLDICDAGQAYLARVPVTAEQAPPTRQRRGAMATSPPLTYPSQGLWLGAAHLAAVSAPYYSRTNVMTTPAPCDLRFLVHVDGSGKARLLQSVTLALAPLGATTNLSYALLTGANPNPPTGTVEMHRLASAAFPVMAPLLLSGVPTMTNGTLSGAFTVGANDPLNPFLHLYHPQHDNKDANWAVYPAAVETYNITRTVTLTFHAATNDLVAHAIWGADTTMGTYREVISGLRRDPIVVEGEFSLGRVCREGDLN